MRAGMHRTSHRENAKAEGVTLKCHAATATFRMLAPYSGNTNVFNAYSESVSFVTTNKIVD